MKNKEKYKNELEALMIRGMSFGIHKTTGALIGCRGGSLSDCNVCAFRETTKTCMEFRKEWLESEEECVEDIWSDFRDLKRGDLIMINKGPLWSPYLFVEFEDDSIVYTHSVDNDGEFQLLLRENDPRWVKKPDRFIKYMEEE